ncbi:MAG: sarcosine oxidase subunit gamma, partial [Alphaproteobacteria bacterium]
FLIERQGAREVLAKGAPVDLSPEAFGTGDLRRSRIGQLAAAFWMTGDESFELVCFRSVGAFMFDWLSNAAREGSLPEYL